MELQLRFVAHAQATFASPKGSPVVLDVQVKFLYLKRMRLSTLLIALAFAPTLAAQAPLPSDSAVLAIIKERVTDKRSAGIVIGMIEPSGRKRIVAYGDPGPAKLPLDSNSVFEIGSISKVFTSTLLSELVAEGVVRLDDPVQKYLPSSVRIPTRNGKQITLAMLSEQNSGLPRMPDNFTPADANNPYADYTVQQMYDFLSKYELPRDPGASFEYSNLGVGLLGHVLSLATKKPYEQLVTERIFVPLNMTHSAIALSPWMQTHLALGHDEKGNVTANWDIPTLAGAGAIRSTMADMLKFAEANLHPERGAIQQAMAFAQADRAAAGPAMRIGLNWITTVAGADTIVWHNGGTGGYRTFIGLMPTKKKAVVILTNSGGAGADDIGLHLLSPTVPLAPKPQPVKQRIAIQLPAATLAQYVGKYQLAPTFIMDVTADTALYLQATGQPRFRLWPETQVDFFTREFDAQVTFVKGPDGVVNSLVLHQGGRDQTAPKQK
jgi:D-alanyl-D-alanine-carboxypeptidase/D-alanyl-D-alanine-endopeptidase